MEGMNASARRNRPVRDLARLAAPFLLIPAGAVYCLGYELLFENNGVDVAGSLAWSFATLIPWVFAAAVFEQVARSAHRRARLLLLGFILGLVAYGASASAALLIGSGAERAFFSRLPLLAVALLCAALYPIRLAGKVDKDTVPTGLIPPIPPGEILFACSAGNYVELHTENRTVVWRQTMRNAERVLRKSGFVRVHRSYLVPWRKIDVLVRDRKGVVEVELHNGRRLPVSSRYAGALAQQTLQ